MADRQSREVIGGKRKCGKTTELIRRAFIDQLYILCANKEIARHIADRAKEMDLNIPYPITIEDLPLETSYVNRVLVDEAEMVLQSLIGRPVESMSTSMSMNELPSLHKGKEQTSPKSSKSIGSLHVDIDCSDALKGLKAVQREARKATRSLKELEEQQKSIKTETKTKPCPKCGSENIEVSKLYYHGEKYPIQIISKCMKCEWTYNE